MCSLIHPAIHSFHQLAYPLNSLLSFYFRHYFSTYENDRLLCCLEDDDDDDDDNDGNNQDTTGKQPDKKNNDANSNES